MSQLVAPVDYGALTNFLLSFLEEQGFQVVQIHEWELKDGNFDVPEESPHGSTASVTIPEHITDALSNRDLSKIVWIGEAGAPIPNKFKLLEDVIAGRVEPTDT